ncbi:MAG: hypothetical protein P8J32_07505 [bacterium]|nr:hypothetical protein [bacterium]
MSQVQDIAALKQEHEEARQKVIQASKAVFDLSSKIDNLADKMIDSIKPETLRVFFPTDRPKRGFPTKVISETPPPKDSTFSKSVVLLEFSKDDEGFADWYQKWIEGRNGATFSLVMSNGDVYTQCSPLGVVYTPEKTVAELAYLEVQ